MYARGEFQLDWHRIQGVAHWVRVRFNCLRLARETGADVRVVEFFAFLHDVRHVPGHPDVTRYRTRGHNIWIARNGAIRINEVASGAMLLELPGADGCRLEIE